MGFPCYNFHRRRKKCHNRWFVVAWGLHLCSPCYERMYKEKRR